MGWGTSDKGDAIAQTMWCDGMNHHEDTTADDTFRFNLKWSCQGQAEQQRDRSGRHHFQDDIISVVVNGRTATASEDDGTDGLTALEMLHSVVGGWRGMARRACQGGGIIAVVLHNIEPQNADNSVAITFKDTEFKFVYDTPGLDDTKVNFGGTTTLTLPAGPGLPAPGVATVTTGVSVTIYNREFCLYDVGQVRQ